MAHAFPGPADGSVITGEHPALAGKTPALADFPKTPALLRRTLNSCNHMKTGEAEVSLRASLRR
jgi:hypothetical protein